MMRVYLLFILTLFALFSCRELVQNEFPEFAPVPTVNSILIADSLLKVHVSIAGSIDSNQLAMVEDAEVLLYVDEQFKEALIYNGNGIYCSNTRVEPLKKYFCMVNVPGYETITCNDSIPVAVELSNIVHIKQAGKNEEGISYPAIQFTFKNNPAEKLYFEAVIRLIQYGNEERADLEAITDPVLLNEGLPIAVFSNELISGQSYTMTINYTTNSGNSQGMSLYPLILELRAANYSYYQFVKQQYLYEIGRYPDGIQASTTAFPIFSNVKNAYGIFAGYSSTQTDTIYPN
jgi:hypothetical protein